MKNFVKLFEAMRSIAIIALVAVIGFGMIACGDGDDPGGNGGNQHFENFKNTKWAKDDYRLAFNVGTDGIYLQLGDTAYYATYGYWFITEATVSANKITGNRTGESFNYVLSNNGNTLTISNFTGTSGSQDRFNGDFTKISP